MKKSKVSWNLITSHPKPPHHPLPLPPVQYQFIEAQYWNYPCAAVIRPGIWMQCFILRVHLYEAHNTRLFSELNLLMFPLRGGLGTGGGQ